MKSFLLLLLVFFAPAITFAQQNLVPNGDAENYTICPTIFNQTDVAGWFSTRETPDYLNTCACSLCPALPYNIVYGYQQAYSGNGCFAAQTYFNASSTDLREFFGCQLISPLVVGTKYYLTFQINCASGGGGGFNLASNNLSARLTTQSYSQSNPIPVDNYSQFHFDTLITDTSNWTLLRSSFVSDSAYSYMSLGNFYDDAHTDTIAIIAGSFGTRAAYYFDNICLSTDSLFSEHFTTSLIDLSPSSNDIQILYLGNGSYQISSNTNSIYNLIIYSSNGQCLKTQTFSGIITFSVPDNYNSDLLLFRITNVQNGNLITQKFLKL